MDEIKYEVGILRGTIEGHGMFECAVYFKPNSIPVKPLAYLIGYANKIKEVQNELEKANQSRG